MGQKRKKQRTRGRTRTDSSKGDGQKIQPAKKKGRGTGAPKLNVFPRASTITPKGAAVRETKAQPGGVSHHQEPKTAQDSTSNNGGKSSILLKVLRAKLVPGREEEV